MKCHETIKIVFKNTLMTCRKFLPQKLVPRKKIIFCCHGLGCVWRGVWGVWMMSGEVSGVGGYRYGSGGCLGVAWGCLGGGGLGGVWGYIGGSWGTP